MAGRGGIDAGAVAARLGWDDPVEAAWDAPHLSVDRSLSTGQNLRAWRMGDGTWVVASGGRVAVMWQGGAGDGAHVLSDARDAAHWRRFLAVDDDYARIRRDVAALGSPVMDEAMSVGDGIRVLHQEPFEALVTSILTQNNNVPRIRRTVAALCHDDPLLVALSAGRATPPGDALSCPVPRAFPSPQAILGAIRDGEPLGMGYRDGYVASACEAWLDGRLAAMAGAAEGRMPYDAGELASCAADTQALLALPGVGPKVAACMCLFGLGHASALPVDVWIRRFEERHGVPWVPEVAGIQQQYAFEWIRAQGRRDGAGPRRGD